MSQGAGVSTLGLADYQRLIESSAAGILAGLDRSGPDATVPSCPEWTVSELVDHVGQIHLWATAIVLGGGPKSETTGVEPGGDLAGWYAGCAARLVEALRGTDPAAEAWNFGPESAKVAGFWSRRQAHETSMHRVDAELAAGDAAVYEPELEADGVAEVFEVMFPRMVARGVLPDLAAPVAVGLAGRPERWLVEPVSDGIPRITAGEDRGAATSITASAGDLVLLLWNRRDPAEVALSIEGDRAVAEGFLRSRLTP